MHNLDQGSSPYNSASQNCPSISGSDSSSTSTEEIEALCEYRCDGSLAILHRALDGRLDITSIFFDFKLCHGSRSELQCNQNVYDSHLSPEISWHIYDFCLSLQFSWSITRATLSLQDTRYVRTGRWLLLENQDAIKLDDSIGLDTLLSFVLFSYTLLYITYTYKKSICVRSLLPCGKCMYW